MLKIEIVESGEVLKMRMEDSIDQMKIQINLLSAIPPQDQILLFGPPFKDLSAAYSQFSTSLDVESKRIFVYNRKILADHTLEPKKVRLYPTEIPPFSSIISSLDTTYKNIMSAKSDNGETRDVKDKLIEYETFFKTQLQFGEDVDFFIQESIKSYRVCLGAYGLTMDGISGAILNVKDILRAQTKIYEHFESKLTKQQAANLALLNNFESTLTRLQSISLHDSIKVAICKYMSVDGNSIFTDSTSSTSGKEELRVVEL
jgi:hypothetical protein